MVFKEVNRHVPKLAKSIDFYEKGVLLIREGQKQLGEMEGKIETLMKSGEIK